MLFRGGGWRADKKMGPVEDTQGVETDKNEPFSQIHYKTLSHHVLRAELDVVRIFIFS